MHEVMGLTLDMHKKTVYWIVRNYEGSTLFRALMADNLQLTQEITPVKMALTQYPDIQGNEKLAIDTTQYKK